MMKELVIFLFIFISWNCLYRSSITTGHFPYARSTRVYLEQMKSLKSKIPADKFHLFFYHGFFTICRKKYFAGNFSDLIIEQDLMRLFKSSGGMTRGRGITDSTITNFVDVMPRCIPICKFLENFSGVVNPGAT